MSAWRFSRLLTSRILTLTTRKNNKFAYIPAAQMTSLHTVAHDNDRQLFYIKLGTEEAILEYKYLTANEVDLTHTEVPESHGGKGIAALLAKAAFEYVVENDLKMKVSCWYLQNYLAKNPLSRYTERIIN